VNLTSIEVHRQINASPAEVYAVWLDPQCAGGPWYGPQSETMQSKVILAPAVDGLFYHRVTNTAYGQTFVHYGRFTALEPGARVEHTWVCEATRGRESIVTTTFVARDGGTLVTVSQTGIPDDEAGRGQDAGWKWLLGALVDTMAARTR